MVTELWMHDLDPVHRAMIHLVTERLADPREKEAATGLPLAELNTMYANLLRFEPIMIPVGTAASVCRWCQAPIYWVTSRWTRDRQESVSVAGEDCRAPSDRPGQGFSHLSDCAHSVYRRPG